MKKTMLRLLAIVVVLAMMVPLFAACGNKKPAETTQTPTSPSTTQPTQTPTTGTQQNPVDPAVNAKKEAIQALLSSLATAGGSADSQISLSLKSELIASLLGENTELPLDVDLGALLGSYADTGLTKDLYNNLLTELVKITAVGNAEITLGSNGNVTYTVPADQLVAVLEFWANSENVNAYLDSLASKAGTEGYLMTEKAFLDLLVGVGVLSLTQTAHRVETFPAPIKPDGTILEIPEFDLVFVDEDGHATPCTEEDFAEVLKTYYDAEEAFEAACQLPVMDSTAFFAALATYYKTMMDLEDRGYYTAFDINIAYDEHGYALDYYIMAWPSYDDEGTVALVQMIDEYIASGDAHAFLDAMTAMALENMINVYFAEDSEDTTEEDYEALEAAEKIIRKELSEIIVNLLESRNGAYEEALAAFEALLAYESEYTVQFAGFHLAQLQNMASVGYAFLLSVNPEEVAITDDGFHSFMAASICQRLGFEIADENGEPTEEYTVLASAILDLLRAIVLAEEFDIEGHTDALLALFEVPFTYEEITTSSALYLIAKLNDTYDFAGLLLTPGFLPCAEDQEFIGMVEILEEELFSYLTLDAEGNIDPTVINKERWEALSLALYNYAVETSSSMPEFLSTALEDLIVDLFAGEEDAFTALAQALVPYVTLGRPEQIEVEEVIGTEYGVMEYRVTAHITVITDAANTRTYGSYVHREKMAESFATIDKLYAALGHYLQFNDIDAAASILEILLKCGAISAEELEQIRTQVAAGAGFTLDFSSYPEYYGEYEVWGMVEKTIYNPIAEENLTDEEADLLAAFQTAMIDLVSTYEAFFHATEETAEDTALAALEAYIDVLTAMRDIAAAELGVGTIGMPPVQVLDIMIALYSYPMAESKLEAGTNVIETLTGMELEELSAMLSMYLLMIGNVEQPSEEVLSNAAEAMLALITGILDPESTDSEAKLLADLLHVVATSYTELNVEFLNQMFGISDLAEEDYQILVTVAMIASLLTAEDIEDYNVYFDGFELPAFIESIDFNLFFAKIKAEGTFTQIFDVQSINVTQIFEGETLVGETFVVTLAADFDIMLAALDGNVTLTFNIVY